MMKPYSINRISKERFNIRILLIFASLIILVAASFTTFLLKEQMESLSKRLQQKGDLLAELLSDNVRLGVFSENRSMLEVPVNSVMSQNGVLSATIFTINGKALYSKGNQPEDFYSINSEVLESLRGGKKTVAIMKGNEWEFWNPIHFSKAALTENTGLPALDEDGNKLSDVIGIVRISLDKTKLDQEIHEVLVQGILIGLGSILATLLITLIIVRQVTTPLERLTKAAEDFGKTQEYKEVEVESNDEIGKLTIAFNEMTSSLKKREEEKEMLEKQLHHRQKMDAIGTLAGGIAHDFNNILSSVLFKVALAKKELISQIDIAPRLNEIEKVFNRARGLTQQLLTFTKGGAPIREATSIAEVIKDTISFSLSGSKVKYYTDFPEGLWAVDVDGSQISQVFNNLVLNAEQAMPKGGKVWITGENVVIEENNHFELKPGSYVKLSIKDTGHGIQPENYKKIFDPYFTTKAQGLGLGLAITYSIIKRHEGHIDVESKLNEGTTFTILLPTTMNEIEKKEDVWELPVHGHGRILLMDDEDTFRRDAAELLEMLGYTVTEAVDGAEALKHYIAAKDKKTPYDVVIMDLTIPGGMGGEETMRKLMKIDSSAKVIVSSGYSNNPIISEYKSHGFKGVIVKPFKVNELTNLINQLI